MVVERQTSFSGGMVDTAADGRLPADSYLFAQNLDLVGGRLVSRPRLVDVRARPLGMETIRNIGLFRFSGSSLGDCLFFIEHNYIVDSFAFCGYLVDASGVDLGIVRIDFPDLSGAGDGLFYGSESEPLAPHYVALQVGGVAYVWVTRGGAGYVFRWDGTVAGSPVPKGAFERLSTEYGTADYIPPCRAALYAYGRVWLAVETGAGGVYSSVVASEPVDNTGVSKLVFDAALKVDCGLGGSDDILGMAALGGGRIVAFKRNSVWLLSGCDREPEKIVVECIDADHGCVGHSAFVVFDQGCWFISDDGIRAVDLSGRAARVPVSQPISGFWKRTVWQAEPSPLVSAVVFGDKLLFSVFVDYDFNSAMLVYSLSGACWVGIWRQDGMECLGLFVGDVPTGRELKMLGSDCSLRAFSLTEPMLFSNSSAGALVSRPFVCGEAWAAKMFTAGSVTLLSTGRYGSEEIPLMLNLYSECPISKVSKTHLAGAVVDVDAFPTFRTFIGRLLRSCCLSLLFVRGAVEIFALSARSSAK
jgi:hypothetical protein